MAVAAAARNRLPAPRLERALAARRGSAYSCPPARRIESRVGSAPDFPTLDAAQLDRGAWRPRAQPEGGRRRPAAQPAGGRHRAVGLGQVVAGLRHAVRRGAAPLRRVAVGLRPPVPRADGEARRRPHRRAVAGHLDRAEDHRLQPPLHGRHGHRDLRLPAPVLRQRRRAALPELRPRDRQPVARAHRRPGDDLSQDSRINVLAPIVRGRKGEFKKELQAIAPAGSPRPASTASTRASTTTWR